MYRKLLKYDFVAVWRIGWILCVAALGLSVIGAFAMRFTYSEIYNNSFINISGGLIFILSVAGISIALAAVQILVLYRFYSNLYTDEGYLTFTLPVKRKTLLSEKLMNAFLWQLIQAFTAAACISIFITFATKHSRGGGFIDLTAWNSVFKILSDIIEKSGAWFAVYAVQGLLLAAALSMCGYSLMYFCITLGAIVVKKYKLLAAIGICYGVAAVSSIVVQITLTLFSTALFEGLAAYLDAMSPTGIRILVSLVILGATAVISAAGAIFYLLTLEKTERKLNLP